MKELRAEVFCLFIILPLTFSQANWNKQNTLHTHIRIWQLGVLTMKKFNNIALAALIIFKVVKST